MTIVCTYKKHNIICGREYYTRLTNDKELRVYEFTTTMDRKKWSIKRTEEKAYKVLYELLSDERLEIKNYGFCHEFHTDSDWIHFHGFFTVNPRRDNAQYISNKLKIKLGRTQVDRSRDGQLDSIKKSYRDWYEYLSKECEYLVLDKCMVHECLLNLFSKEVVGIPQKIDIHGL